MANFSFIGTSASSARSTRFRRPLALPRGASRMFLRNGCQQPRAEAERYRLVFARERLATPPLSRKTRMNYITEPQ